MILALKVFNTNWVGDKKLKLVIQLNNNGVLIYVSSESNKSSEMRKATRKGFLENNTDMLCRDTNEFKMIWKVMFYYA